MPIDVKAKAGQHPRPDPADRRAALDERDRAAATSSTTRCGATCGSSPRTARDIPALARDALARDHWTDLEDEDDIEDLLSNGKDRLVPIAFSAEPMSLLDLLPSRKKDNRAGRGCAAPGSRAARARRRRDRSARRRATLRARRAALAVSRAARVPARRHAAALASPSSVRPARARRSLIHQWIADRLAEDGYPIHKNLDRVPPRLAALRQAPDRRHVVSRRVGGALPRGARGGAQAQGHPVDRGPPPVRPARPVAPERAQLRRLLPRPGAARRPRDRRRAHARAARAPRARRARARRGARRSSPSPPHRPARPRSCCSTRSARSRSGCQASRCIRSCRAPRSSSARALFPWRARPGRRDRDRAPRRRGRRTRADDEREVTPNDVLEHLARTTGLSIAAAHARRSRSILPRSRPRSPRA